ncbi:hypothetical protein BIW11_09895 [Tropilaelaps mercedesae]|uniref:Uncharacterized protein n=1 Tax=Tropilaelaps mercedesae TaxID=418985 RepID=A0A1V9XI20_9ACAR|nr:hypothetical protein BIW11_09895 [Tropilaelaps mercedesae]
MVSFLPKEKITEEYQAMKWPRESSAVSRRGIVVYVAVFVLALVVVFPSLISVWSRSGSASRASIGVLSNDDDNSIDGDRQVVERTVAAMAILATTTSPTTAAATGSLSPNRSEPLVTIGTSGLLRGKTTQRDGEMPTRRSVTRTTSLEEWLAFLNMSTPATGTPPNLVSGSMRLTYPDMSLFVEVNYDREYCLAVVSLRDSIKQHRNTSFDLQAYGLKNFANVYQRLDHNFSAPEDLYKLGLNLVYEYCKDLPVIPVRQTKEFI